MKSSILIKENTLSEVYLFETYFEINNEKFFYQKIKNFKYQNKKINWILTIMNSLIGFLIDSNIYEIERNKQELIFRYEEIPKRISLKKCNIFQVENTVKLINEKITFYRNQK
ncbi:hypothetical protein Q4595_05795 [Wenyingzhuangia sp. 1_MG-2023]|nr:hypothetical protein [Wenyingzhuangia sp. 1_MG-2023]